MLLHGLMPKLSRSPNPNPDPMIDSRLQEPPTNETSRYLPSKIIASVHTPIAVSDIALPYQAQSGLTVVANGNVRAAQEANIVILACKAESLGAVMQEAGFRDALRNKLVVSIVGGLSEEMMYKAFPDLHCRFVQVYISAAAAVGESVTIVPSHKPALAKNFKERIKAVFETIGENVLCPAPKTLSVCTAMQSCVPVFVTMILEAMIDAAVSKGMSHRAADMMIRHLMMSTFYLMDKTTPFALRERLTLPGECAIAGVMALEEGALRGVIAHGLRTSIDAEKSLVEPRR